MVGQKLGRNLASVKTVLAAEPNFMEKERSVRRQMLCVRVEGKSPDVKKKFGRFIIHCIKR